MVKHNIKKLFEKRKGHLDYRVKRDYIRNGVAIIPCRISDYDDIVSKYSVEDYETLNPDFYEYVKTTAELTPSQSPLVLNIIGNCLSKKEKETIDEIIRDDFAYDLGGVEKKEKRHTQAFVTMTVGFVVVGILLWLTQSLAEVPRELIFILFWFLGETLCDYLFLSGYDLRQERLLAGRLASIKVVFSDNYVDRDYTEKDVNELFFEIERDVNKTIQSEEESAQP